MQTKLLEIDEMFPAENRGGFIEGVAEILIISISGCAPKKE